MNIETALRQLERRTDGSSGSGEALAAILDVLGEPQRAAPVVLVDGGRGAGTVAPMVAALLKAQGLSVARWSATHLERVHEHMAWDGEPVDDDTLGTLIGDVVAIEDLTDVTLTATELLAAAAFRWFAEVAADVVVVEAGPTGMAEAVADPAVEVWTGAPREVRSVEGTWTESTDFGVAADRVAVGGRLLDLRTPGTAHDEIYLPVHGSHLAADSVLAVAAAEALLGRPQPTDAVTEALSGLALPARFEVVARHPTVVLDIVDDAEAAAATAATLAEDLTLAGSVLLVVGLRAPDASGAGPGSDPEAILDALGAASAGLVVTCSPPGPGAVAASDLAGVADRLGAITETAPEPIEALNRVLAVATEDDLVLVAGAAAAVGPIRAALREMETAS